MHFRRLVPALLTAMAISVTTACGGGDTGPAPLSVTDYRGADWVTDGTVTPPKTTSRADRIRYPHSMDGAVMAAVDSQALLSLAGDAEFGGVARDYFAITPGLQDYLNARAAITTSSIDTAKMARLQGFRFFGYDEDKGTATVEVFYEQIDRSITGVTRHLVWTSDNWLIQLPDKTEKQVKAYPALPDDLNPLSQT